MKASLYIYILIIFFNIFSKVQAQVIATENFDGPAIPFFAIGFGATGSPGSTGVAAGPLNFTYSNILSTPVATPKSAPNVLKLNCNTPGIANRSFFLRSSVLDFSENCPNSQLTISFWMYRSGNDNNADRINVYVDVNTTIAGATLLTTVHRSRALSPIVYGVDGWYKYEAVIPATFNTNTNYLFIDGVGGVAGGFGDIYVDNFQFYHSNGNAANTDGAVANAGEDVTICSGGSIQIGSITVPNTVYSWAPATGLSATNISNPKISLATAGTFNYTVTAQTSGCTPTHTDVVAVNVLATTAPVISSAVSTNICSGSALSFPFTASNAPTGYIWLASDNVSTTGESNITTVNAATLNDNITSASPQVVTYSVSAYNATCLAGTNPVQIFSVNVNTPPSATSPVNTTICAGGSANFNTTASGGGAYTYQWQRNGVNIGGATASSLSITEPVAGTYSVRCIVSNACAPSVTTSNATLTVISPPVLTISGTNVSCNGGANGTANVVVSSGGPAATYLWSTGGNTSSISGLVAGTYACTVTSVSGCTAAISTTIIQPVIPLNVSFSGPSFVCSGSTTGVTINVVGGTPGFNYNWIATSNTNVTGESLISQTTNVINNTLVNTSGVNQNVIYNVSVTDANSCVASATKTISVTNTVVTSTALANTTVCEVNNASFNTTASGGSGSYGYQWYFDNGGGFTITTDGVLYSGSNTNSLTITTPPTSMNNNRYKCVIFDGCTSHTTSVGILNVNAAFNYSNYLTEQPILSDVGRCSSKQEILRMRIDMTAGSCPSTPSVTSFDINANGTHADVKKAYIYYTGSNSNFVNTNLFATIPNVVVGNMTITGSKPLINGSNYFWLVYDIDPAGSGGTVDASWINFNINGGGNPGLKTVSTGNPPGVRNITTCYAPGGISSGLTFWLKSNDGTNINGSVHDAPVNLWSSSFSYASDLTQSDATRLPAFKDYPHDTTFNFNPYIQFDGNNDNLQNTSITNLLDDNGLALIVCARSTTPVPNNNTCFGFQSSDGGIAYQILPEKELRYRNSAAKEVSFDVTGFTDPDSDFIMAKMVGISGNSSGTPDFADFMRNDDVFQSTGTNNPDLETGLTIGGNGNGAGYNFSNSKIAEIITYNTYLPKVDLDKVQTYAAIKYGIHLNKDYVSSNGDTIWNFSADPTYNNDIAGIGRDDKAALNQKQTQSVNKDEMLTIGLDSIENSNKNNTAVFAENNSFLVWGNNNLTPQATYSTVIPFASLPLGIEGRIQRVWKLQGTNFGTSGNNFKTDSSGQKNMGVTTIEVAFDDYLLAGTSPVSSLRLLIDDDGDFSNAIIKGPGKSTTGATAQGSRISFDGVEVGPGRNFITLATTDKAITPLPTELINFNVMCDNNHAIITWNTASEVDVKEYSIEQSFDGINFTTIKIISAKGNTNFGANYSVTHNLTASKINYFRLKETTTKNDYYYFNTVSVSGTCNDELSNNRVQISPNPITSGANELTMKFDAEISGITNVKIMNTLGNCIQEKEYKSNENYSLISLPANELKPGIYFIEIKNNRVNSRLKFIVKE